MLWLQAGYLNFENGLGGVEVHARSLKRELVELGWDAEFLDFRKHTDASASRLLRSARVVHTHGSSGLSPKWIYWLKKQPHKKRPIWVHTLHGSTWGRMRACGEWTWPGGYAAYFREWRSAQFCDLLAAVQPQISLYRYFKQKNKPTLVCWNGWDSSLADSRDALDSELLIKLKDFSPFWLFLGRGSDPVKGADRIIEWHAQDSSFRVVAAPGEGFQDQSWVIQTGLLSSPQVHQLLTLTQGLLAPSRYEGLPLVVLEALALGVPVFTAELEGVIAYRREIGKSLEGLFTFSPHLSLSEQMKLFQEFIKSTAHDPNRQQRSQTNRSLLWSWKNTTKTLVDAAQRILE